MGDFLSADPADLAERLHRKGVDTDVIKLWQSQARLVMDVPGLRGTHAQLLVGAGYPDVDALARASQTDLADAILRFATTVEGQRILRQGHPPGEEKIKAWIDSAASRIAA